MRENSCVKPTSPRGVAQRTRTAGPAGLRAEGGRAELPSSAPRHVPRAARRPLLPLLLLTARCRARSTAGAASGGLRRRRRCGGGYRSHRGRTTGRRCSSTSGAAAPPPPALLPLGGSNPPRQPRAAPAPRRPAHNGPRRHGDTRRTEPRSERSEGVRFGAAFAVLEIKPRQRPTLPAELRPPGTTAPFSAQNGLSKLTRAPKLPPYRERSFTPLCQSRTEITHSPLKSVHLRKKNKPEPPQYRLSHPQSPPQSAGCSYRQPLLPEVTSSLLPAFPQGNTARPAPPPSLPPQRVQQHTTAAPRDLPTHQSLLTLSFLPLPQNKLIFGGVPERLHAK